MFLPLPQRNDKYLNRYMSEMKRISQLQRKKITFKSDFLIETESKARKKQYFQEIQEDKVRIKDFISCLCVLQIQSQRNTPISMPDLREYCSHKPLQTDHTHLIRV
jgi:hypothetical protein